MSQRASIFAADSNGIVGKNDGPANHVSGKSDTASGANGSEGTDNFIDPGSIGDQGSGGDGDNGIAGSPVRKKRGRKPGSTNAKNAQTLSVDGLASIILNGHALLASLTKSQEFFLDAEEAKTLAQASANVSRHYGVAMAAKTVDWINLGMVVSMIYGTRLAAIRMRKRGERPAKKSEQPASQNDPYAGLPPDYLDMQ